MTLPRRINSDPDLETFRVYRADGISHMRRKLARHN